MAEVNYGRIALIPRGDFSGNTQYEQGDVVSYEGSSYVAKSRPPLATLPTDTEYWQVSAQGSRYIYLDITKEEFNKRLAAYRADPGYTDPDTGNLFSETYYNVTDDYEALQRDAANLRYTDTFMLGSANLQGIIDIIANKVLNELLSKQDVVDNAESTAHDLPVSADQFRQLYERIGNSILTENKNVYVDATNGNDVTGDGTQAKPWATIQKAVDECPLSGSGKNNYTVCIANGKYRGNVIIRGKSIIISTLEETPDIKIIGYIDVCNNSTVLIYTPLTVDASNAILHGVFVRKNSYAYIGKAITVIGLGNSNGRVGIIAAEGSSIFVNCNNTTIKDFYGGIMSNQCSKVYAGIISFENCNTAALSEISSDLTLHFGTLTNVTTKIKTGLGGRFNQVGPQGWQFIGTATGANSVSIDSGMYTEFFVVQRNGNRTINYNVISNQLSSELQLIDSGNVTNSTTTTGTFGRIGIRSTSIEQIMFLLNNTSDVTASTTMTVYGRRA